MFINGGQFELRTKERVLREEQKTLQNKIETHASAPKGTLDFCLHKLVKQKNEVKQELARVSSKLRPDPNSIA
jgi:hypothetical protein